jgi:hypothetical protein
MLTKQTILIGNSIFSEFKGALTEQFILQNLKTRGRHPTSISGEIIVGWRSI